MPKDTNEGFCPPALMTTYEPNDKNDREASKRKEKKRFETSEQSHAFLSVCEKSGRGQKCSSGLANVDILTFFSCFGFCFCFRYRYLSHAHLRARRTFGFCCFLVRSFSECFFLEKADLEKTGR
jgi:hypothetical protein